ncbi:unnamed protein product [Cunninghamella blakesleeana]
MVKSFQVIKFTPNTLAKIQGAAVLSLRGIYESPTQHQAHSQYLADQTGADIIIPHFYDEMLISSNHLQNKEEFINQFEWSKTVNELQGFTEFLYRSKYPMIGAFGVGLGGGISCALASQMALTNHPLKALVTLYGTPLRGFDVRQITKTTPIQGHFGGKDTLKGFSDPTAVDIFEFNLKTNTTAESMIFKYPEQGHGFLSDEEWSIEQRKKYGLIANKQEDVYTTEKEIRELAWSRIIQFLVDQLSHHEQSVNI